MVIMHHRYIIEHYLNEKESEEFAEWAFGENYKGLIRNELVFAWNQRHYEKMRISIAGNALEDIPKMIEIWKSSKANNDQK